MTRLSLDRFELCLLLPVRNNAPTDGHALSAAGEPVCHFTL